MPVVQIPQKGRIGRFEGKIRIVAIQDKHAGERKYYLSNLPSDTPIKGLASAIKARWLGEQAHQRLKEEMGFNHFEGRSGAAPTLAHVHDRAHLPPIPAAQTGQRG